MYWLKSLTIFDCPGPTMIPPHLLRNLMSSDDDYYMYLPLIYFIFFSVCFLLFRFSQRFHVVIDSSSTNRLNIDDRPSTSFSAASIPFKISLSRSYSSLREGIELQFECFEQCTVQYFWSVQTNLFIAK